MGVKISLCLFLFILRQNLFCNELWWLSTRYHILNWIRWSSIVLSKACFRIAVALQQIRRVWADKWGVWLSGPPCYLGAAMYSRLLCRRWRQVTRREAGKGRKKGVWRGERERQSDRHRHTEGGEDKKKNGEGVEALWLPGLRGMWCGSFFSVPEYREYDIVSVMAPHPC